VERVGSVKLDVEHGDVVAYTADVLVLKYARQLYGADSAVYTRLHSAHINVIFPSENEWSIGPTKGAIPTPRVIFVGVPSLYLLNYPQIRDFGRIAIAAIADVAPDAQHVALTLHGPGYGLDEAEAFESELAGILEGLRTGRVAPNLRKITFVEFDERRAVRLANQLRQLLPAGEIVVDRTGRPQPLPEKSRQLMRHAGTSGAIKPRLFVAMPFREEMADFFEFGILRPAKKLGYICERADREIFTDDIVQWVKERIATADVFLADLTGANPNVYLEVGYAWGHNRPTVLVVRNTDDLRFDVKTQKCFVYGSIKQLEQQVRTLLKALRPAAR
jgi:hypothetical protein